MDVLITFLSITLPAAAVVFAMYLTVKAFLNKEFQQQLVQLKVKNTDLIMPARLQAYERICLLLERISPHNLVLRVNEPTLSASELQALLLASVREEFNHNLSQQVYMSDQAWALVKNAIQEVNTLINKSSEGLVNRDDARGIDLARAIFENMLHLPEDPTTKAIKFVKQEIQQLF